MYIMITNLIYEGKVLEINLGDSETRELKHFVMECNYDLDEDDENVGFDYALEFIKWIWKFYLIWEIFTCTNLPLPG